tara:strand:- start:43 stop:468 length:426 start_codon:yes stop_codon:yes gene_type:complete
MNSLIYNPKIEVKKSSIHGYGVFAKENIKKGEVLEECHYISIPKVPLMSFLSLSLEKEKILNFISYFFRFPKTKSYKEIALPLGNGCIYNSSITPNADWETNEKTKLFIFKSIKKIKKGEEILTNYHHSVTNINSLKNKML